MRANAPGPSDPHEPGVLARGPSGTHDITTKIVDAAIAEFTDFGLRRVSVDDIARRAGVHRVTVYKHFKNKDEVVTATANTWLHRFFTKIADTVANLPTPEERIIEGFTLSLHNMRAEPLAMRLLQDDPEITLPYVTTQGGATMAAVRTFYADHLRRELTDTTEIDIDEAAELIARTGLSLLLTPQSVLGTDTADGIRRFANRYLRPLFSDTEEPRKKKQH